MLYNFFSCSGEESQNWSSGRKLNFLLSVSGQSHAYCIASEKKIGTLRVTLRTQHSHTCLVKGTDQYDQ